MMVLNPNYFDTQKAGGGQDAHPLLLRSYLDYNGVLPYKGRRVNAGSIQNLAENVIEGIVLLYQL